MAKFQIKGADNVIEAYSNREVKAWGIWQDKQFLTTGGSEQELETFLDLIAGGDRRAVYTLKVFDKIEDHKEINEKTPSNGSFNFVLAAPVTARVIDGEYPQEGTPRPRSTWLKDRLDAMDERIASITGPQDQPETIGDIVKGLIQNPGELMQLVQVAQMLGIVPVRQPAPVPVQAMAGARLGNVETKAPSPGLTVEEKLPRLSAAIDILDKNDPAIVEHLEKLADISEKSPGQFSFLLKALEQF